MTHRSGDGLEAYWSEPADRLFGLLESGANGLSSAEAGRRLSELGPNALKAREELTVLAAFLGQFRSPLVLILIFAAAVSALVQEWVDAVIILAIVLGSAVLSFVQEYSASTAVEKLRRRVTLKATALRDGLAQLIRAEEVVPGDVVLLSAGSLIPADGVVLDARDFHVNQAVLTGETFPVEKSPGTVPTRASLPERSNSVFMGTTAGSGTARVLITRTGSATEFGQIAERLTLRPPETEFERGIRHFGYLLTQVMLVLVLVVFAVNVFGQKPPVDSLLFAIALAVGLAPELLPAIITVNLSKGAQHMASHGVIVRQLNAIENLGSMDVLCTDKTGTLTEGVVRLDGALDVRGEPSEAVLRHAFLNARFQTGLPSPLDDAIIGRARESALDVSLPQKVDEIPYDFLRKRLSVVVEGEAGERLLITKGALEPVLEISIEELDGERRVPVDQSRRREILGRYAGWSEEGFRVLGVATRVVPRQARYGRADEAYLTFAGFLLFFDPPKPGIEKTLADLRNRGVELKVITGDNRRVALHLARAVGLEPSRVLTGAELADLHDEALWHAAERTTVFAEVDPGQKERLILALGKMGHVVGYMGDGINDAPALHAADVGISVDQAVDVAKEAADFVLLEQDLDVLREGIEEGRRTFANTLKYVFTTTSANFGNMFSMAAASLFLPFLPLLAKQILLNNFLSDFPAMTIAGDNVDREMLDVPHRWNVRFIRNFMVVFGLVSSAFDFLTFALLLYVLRAGPYEFRTGWFLESLLTELAIALVVRTRRSFWRSRPGRLLSVSTVLVAILTLALPYLPSASLLGFTPLPANMMLILLLITALYVAASEATKRVFYRRATL